MRLAHVLLLALLLGSPAALSAQERGMDEALHLAGVWLDAQLAYDKLPGMSVAIVQGQDVLWSQGFGYANPETRVPATPATLYSICSISKLFTSVGVMRLYDEERIRLDDRVQDVLPWYTLRQQYDDSAPVTLRGLLTHASGLPRESAHPYWTGPNFPFPTSEAIREGLSRQETLYPASRYFQYSNLGMALLGSVIEEVSGTTYDDYIQRNLLQPLGMQSTYTDMPAELHGTSLALGYGALTRQGTRDRMNLYQTNGISAAAGFASTVEDLARFAAWQLRVLETGEAEILRASTLRDMQRIHWTDPDGDVTWGLGFSVWREGDGVMFGHGGSCPGYRSQLTIDPARSMAYTVMINAGGTNPSTYIRGIRQILGHVDGLAPDPELPVNLADYQGYFDRQPWVSEVYIAPWEGRLVMLSLPTHDPGQGMTFFEHVEGDTFVRIRPDGESGETLTFERDATGKVMRFEIHNNYGVRIER